MKNILRVFALILLSSVSAFAQHSVTLSCTPSVSIVIGYNVYRSTNNGSTYTKLTTIPVTACAYVDAAVQGGIKYVYVMTALSSSSESIYSNAAAVTIPEAPPTNVKAVSSELILDKSQKDE